MVTWWAARAWPIGMKFADYDRRIRRQTARHRPQDQCRIVGVMQNHGHQSRRCADMGTIERRRVRDDPFDLRDASFALYALKITQGLGRAVQCIDKAA